MEVSTTVEVEITDVQEGYLKARAGEERFSIAGDGAVGETRDVRVIRRQEDTIIAITEGASIRIRIDEAVDDSTVRADPDYGPVFVPVALSPGDWWRCVVIDVRDDRITAEPQNKIPRNSSIPRGPPPQDPTQSLNHLLKRG